MNGDFNDFKKYYQILEVTPWYASWSEIDKSYKKLSIKYHPDKLRQRLDGREPTEQEQKTAKEKYELIKKAHDELKKYYQGNGNYSEPEVKEFVCDFCSKLVRLREDYFEDYLKRKEKIVGNSEKGGSIWCCSSECLEKAVNCYRCGEVGKQGHVKHIRNADVYYCKPCYNKLKNCAQCQKKLTGQEAIWYVEKGKPERFCSENCAREWKKKNQPIENNQTEFYTTCKKCSKRFSYTCSEQKEAEQVLDQKMAEHYLAEHPQTTPENEPLSISEGPVSNGDAPVISSENNPNITNNDNPNDNSDNDQPNQKNNNLTTIKNEAEQRIEEILKKYNVKEEELKNCWNGQKNYKEYLDQLDSLEKINDFVKKIETQAQKRQKTTSQSNNGGLSKKAQVGITVGISLGIVVLVGGIIIYQKRKSSKI